MALTLTTDERTELERRVRSRKIRAEDARRAQVILMLAAGESFATITTTVGCYPDYVNRWKQRFEAERLAGLRAKYRGQPATIRTPAMEARILAKTRHRPPDGSTHWSTRKLAKVLGISHVLVARVWRRAGLQPHRLERYMASDDPDFEQKTADVLGLYLNPPQHAVVFAADEKTAIQALDRLDPVLPLSPGRAERHGFEYLPPRHPLVVRGAQYPHRRDHRPDRAPAYQRRLRGVPDGYRRHSAPPTRDSRHCRQSLPRTRPKPFRRFFRSIRGSSCISRRPIRPGSIRWSSGLPRSSGTCWLAASSPRSPTWLERFVDTSRATTKIPNRSAGPTAIRRIELLLIQLIQSTSRTL